MNKYIFWVNSYPNNGKALITTLLLGSFFSKGEKISLEKIHGIGVFEMTRKLNFIKSINFE